MQEADEAYPVSTDRVDEITQIARQNNVQLVLPAPIGRLLTAVGRINDRLGLSGVSEFAALNCVDKRGAHLLLAEAGVPLADQVLVTHGDIPLMPFSFAVIIKPRFGAGSRGVQVCHTLGELYLARQAIEGDALVESLISGTEYGVDGAAFNGG